MVVKCPATHCIYNDQLWTCRLYSITMRADGKCGDFSIKRKEDDKIKEDKKMSGMESISEVE